MHAARCPRASRVTVSCASATSCSRARLELVASSARLPLMESVARTRHGPPTRVKRCTRAVAKESTCCHSSAYAWQCMRVPPLSSGPGPGLVPTTLTRSRELSVAKHLLLHPSEWPRFVYCMLFVRARTERYSIQRHTPQRGKVVPPRLVPLPAPASAAPASQSRDKKPYPPYGRERRHARMPTEASSSARRRRLGCRCALGGCAALLADEAGGSTTPYRTALQAGIADRRRGVRRLV